MDNDPKSYRVPILHLADVLPVEDASIAAPAPTPATSSSAPQKPGTPSPQIDEAQKLHEAFIAKTQAELKKKANKPKPGQDTVVVHRKKKKRVVSPPPLPDQGSKEIPVHFKKTSEVDPLEKVATEVNNIMEDEVGVGNQSFLDEETKDIPGAVVLEKKPDASLEKKKDNESILEKLVTVAAEKLDPIPNHKAVPYTGEEISQLFDSYLRDNPIQPEEKEEVAEENEAKIVENVSLATFLPDPLDIWEQDATKPRKNTFAKKNVQPSKAVRTEKDASNTDPVHQNPEPEKELFIPPVTSTTKKNEAGWEEEMKKTLERVSNVQKQNIPLHSNFSSVDIEKPENFAMQEEKQELETTTVPQRTLSSEDVPSQPSEAPLQRITYVPKEINPVQANTSKARFPEREQNTAEKQELETTTVPQRTLSSEDVPSQPSETLQTETTIEHESDSNAETSHDSNLSSLRERILKNREIETPESGTPSSLDTEHATLSNTISEKIELLGTASSSEPEGKARPQSKHASALSNVADKLRQISTEGVGEHNEAQNVVETQSVDTEKKKTPPAPGEIREPEPVPPPNTTISPIRTFRQDVAQAVIKNKTSVVNMISAEEKRRTADTTIRTVPQTASSTLSYVFIGASIVLVAGALAIGAYVFIGYVTSGRSENTSVLSLINKTVSYVITDLSREEIQSGLVNIRENTHNSLGSIIEIELHERVIGSVAGSDDILTSRIGPSEFLEKIAPNAPGGLVRSAQETLILGIHEMSTNEIFLLFKVDHRDTAFRGMFEWEETMDKDLSPLFGPPVERKVVPQQQNLPTNNTSTGTDQYIEKPADVYEKVVYEDLFVSNKEVRGLRNEKGELVLLWAMPDDSTVLITSNEVTMRTVLEQLATQAYAN